MISAFVFRRIEYYAPTQVFPMGTTGTIPQARPGSLNQESLPYGIRSVFKSKFVPQAAFRPFFFQADGFVALGNSGILVWDWIVEFWLKVNRQFGDLSYLGDFARLFYPRDRELNFE